jgi:hypothetical protein
VLRTHTEDWRKASLLNKWCWGNPCAKELNKNLFLTSYKNQLYLDAVVQTYNPDYLEGGDGEDHDWKPVQAKSETPSQSIPMW